MSGASPLSAQSGWAVAARVALFWALYGSIFLGVGAVMGLAPPSARLLVAGIVVSAVTLVITHGFVRRERLAATDVGVAWSRGSVGRFALGVAFGLAMLALLLGVSRVVIGPSHFVRVEGVGVNVVAMMIATYIALSAGEELGFRGYPFRRLHASFGPWVAQLTVALAFAIYHMIQGWDPVSALIGTTAGSIVFGVATLASGGLAYPIGLHAAWNFGSWAMGTKGDPGIWRLDLAGSGPPSAVAAGVVYLTVMAVSTVALGLWMRRR